MNLCKEFWIVCFVFVLKVHGKVTDEEYASMPPVFHLDDFDRCMFLGENALYCSVTVQLAPVDPSNYSKVWKVINEVISQPKNYRHDYLRHGICVSETCTELANNISIYKNDLKLLKADISKCYTNKYRDSGIKGFVAEIHCETEEPFYSVDVYDVSVALFLLAWFILVVCASFYEGLARYKTKEEYEKITQTNFGKIISCFSIPKNWKRLGSMNTGPDAQTLRAINGIRFYNMFLVVMTHACMVNYASPVSNPQYAEKLFEEPLNMLVINGGFAIQSFLLISGLLLTYNFFSKFEGNAKFKVRYILFAFIHRYIRLTPCLLVMIAISSTWLYHLDRGPAWDRIVGMEYRNCRANWWTNLLYINNYYNSEHMCLQQTWYLATDTQLFVLSLIIITIMWKYQKHIKSILAGSLLVAILILGAVNYVRDYDIVLRQYPEPLYNILLKEPQFHEIYAAGHANIGGYVIGLIAGYAIYKCRNKKMFTSKVYVTIWWIIIWGLPLSVIFAGVPIYSEGYQSSRFGAAIYVALAKNVFVAGIALAMFGFSQGIGWFLRDAPHWAPLQILGRLTYCVYLVHVMFVRIRAGHARSPFYMSSYVFFTNTVGDTALAYIFATILCIFVELPVSALQKLLVPQPDNTEKTENLPEKSASVISTEYDNVYDNKVSKV